ncbi:aminoglycoside phosphotransferase family protein [Caulobacter sp. KR2-114]|uniref:aminoglycoside phosphotransferase family protein n=1 Tax=Caulobacter sp. KR2-114 TaxID=3400912 RepID=UPI003C09CD98
MRLEADLAAVFEPWLALWGLEPDGAPIVTPSSKLLPVRRGREAAMLKAAMHAEEIAGHALMGWWAGRGAARLLAAQADAVLLERVVGERSLATMAQAGEDLAAMTVLCDAAAALHAPRAAALPPTLVPLARWFRALAPSADKRGGVLGKAFAISQGLLADQHEVGPLHGDIHHGNILDGGARGWLAIDPKGLLGDRGYDYANMICNPGPEPSQDPARIAARVDLVADRSGLGRERLLRWLLAYCGLSAAWTLDGDWQGDARPALRIAEMAAGWLGA